MAALKDQQESTTFQKTEFDSPALTCNPILNCPLVPSKDLHDIPDSEALDSLSEEQVEQLLQDALDINMRLRNYERKQIAKETRQRKRNEKETKKTMSTTNVGKQEGPKCGFLPPVDTTRTSLVAQKQVIQDFHTLTTTKLHRATNVPRDGIC